MSLVGWRKSKKTNVAGMRCVGWRGEIGWAGELLGT